MDGEQKKEYLQQYIYSLVEEHHIYNKICEYREKTQSIKSIEYNSVKSPNRNIKGIDHYLAMIEELNEKYEEQKNRSNLLKKIILRWIKTISDTRTRNIMKLIYINCMGVKQIAIIFNVSSRTIERELLKGLDLLSDPEDRNAKMIFMIAEHGSSWPE